MGLAVVAFAGAAFGLGRHHGHSGAVDGDVEHVRPRRGRRQRHHLAGADRVGLGGDGRAGRGAAGFGGPLDPLGGQIDAGQFGEQAAGLGERHGGRRPGGHLGQSRRHRGLPDAEFGVPGDDAVPAAAQW